MLITPHLTSQPKSTASYFVFLTPHSLSRLNSRTNEWIVFFLSLSVLFCSVLFFFLPCHYMLLFLFSCLPPFEFASLCLCLWLDFVCFCCLNLRLSSVMTILFQCCAFLQFLFLSLSRTLPSLPPTRNRVCSSTVSVSSRLRVSDPPAFPCPNSSLVHHPTPNQ
ncbi:hypothetical protein DL93DRAFT_1994173 [Clavulina sp. PMI_390]|nr:hypothetical protein DL93DRAFT_1994173 [Clavulina sp. PMI_390]